MINDIEKRMEKRRREYQQDRMVYTIMGMLLKWGIITWLGLSAIWWLVGNFAMN